MLPVARQEKNIRIKSAFESSFSNGQSAEDTGQKAEDGRQGTPMECGSGNAEGFFLEKSCQSSKSCQDKDPFGLGSSVSLLDAKERDGIWLILRKKWGEMSVYTESALTNINGAKLSDNRGISR